MLDSECLILEKSFTAENAESFFRQGNRIFFNHEGHEKHEERLKNKFIVRRKMATKKHKMHKRDKKTAKKVLFVAALFLLKSELYPL